MASSHNLISGRGRGRGRGIVQHVKNPSSQDDFAAVPSVPGPSSSGEDDFISELRQRLPSSSSASGPSNVIPDDDEDDFISHFRSLHPFAGQGKYSHFSEPASDTSLLPKSSKSRQREEGESSQRRVVTMRGEKGEEVALCVNFIRLEVTENTGLFEYHVDFHPFVEDKRTRSIILRSDQKLGQTQAFDGAKLYLPYRLNEPITISNIPHPNHPQDNVEVTIKLVKEKGKNECVHFYNILLRKVMDRLGYVELQRNFYDYQSVFEIPEHKLDIWPGLVTAIDNYEGGLMLCCDSSFRILRTETMLEVLHRFQYFQEEEERRGMRRGYNAAEKFRDYALGKIVLTKYNNKHYRIDDIDWEKSPKSMFTLARAGKEISFVQYYKENYNIDITDLHQPLLVTRAKTKAKRWQSRFGNPPENILLVPSLCFVTGMSEDITSDYRTMKTIAEKTRIPPLARVRGLEEFIRKVNSDIEARGIFEAWGIRLAEGMVNLTGRMIQPPKIGFGNDLQIDPRGGEFRTNLVLEQITISNWLLICAVMDEHKARKVMQLYSTEAPRLGIRYQGDAQIILVQRPSPQEYRRALVQGIVKNRTQFVTVIIPSNRDDLYKLVKQTCLRDVPIASQVILSKTLGNEQKQRSVMQKIALQINCKLGGALWRVKIPLPEKIMLLGMDVYHDPRRRNASVTAIVASVNLTYTKYYTRTIFQEPQEETISSMRSIIVEALQTFVENCGDFPERVLMFRDGVGDGQLEMTREHEVSQMLAAFEDLGISPMFTFIIVQKRINARLFLKNGGFIDNPKPGTVLDHGITRESRFDFFLVSQLIREGTVNPTHYIILYDNSSCKPDLVQKFAYATSYMYYNWSGAIRVPAMCQYAHKAAGLVGQHLGRGRDPSPALCDKLYYL